MLFASDEELKQLQKTIRKWREEDVVSPQEARREFIEDARELRHHARVREFAWLLFVLPVLVAIASVVADLVFQYLK